MHTTLGKGTRRRRRGRWANGPSAFALIAWCTADDPGLRSSLAYALACGLHTRQRRFSSYGARFRLGVLAIVLGALACLSAILIVVNLL